MSVHLVARVESDVSTPSSGHISAFLISHEQHQLPVEQHLHLGATDCTTLSPKYVLTLDVYIKV